MNQLVDTPAGRRARLDRIRANIFPPAWAAIDDWHRFAWHRYADSPKSSQALAISVFGSIKILSQPSKDAVLASFAELAGLPTAGPWTLELEWKDPENRLCEPRQTQVDAAAFSPHAAMFFECKFTEEGGACSQTVSDNERDAACSGAFSVQRTHQESAGTRCALSAKGIRYWNYIPALFGLSPDADYHPCPFASDAYQWMRNLALARSYAEATGKAVRVFAAYADAPMLRTAAKIATGDLAMRTVRAEDAIIPLSYQRIIEIGSAVAAADIWSALAKWVQSRIEIVGQESK